MREVIQRPVSIRRASVAVQLVGFGSFEAKERPARVGRNPRTSEPMTYPACKVPVFKPGKALKDAIR
ncbi:HU family DNA-binding protein [Agathobaculum hominis]